MHVLVVSQYFWPENFRINDTVLGLKSMGYEITVLTGKPNYPGGDYYPGYGLFRKSREKYHGVDVIRVPLVPRGNGSGMNLALNYISFAFFASIFGPFLCRGDYDVIFVYEPSPITVGLPAVVLKKLKDIPILFWVQDLWPESLSATGAVRTKWILLAVEKIVKVIYENCDRILVQSKAFFSPIEKLGIAGSRIYYFPNSAEELYQPIKLDENAPERAVVPSGFKIMFAGNIGAAQDFETILTAAEKLKGYADIHWVIIGEGRLSLWVKEQIDKRELGKVVHLLGKYGIESMPRFFSLADVMLVILKKQAIFSMTIPAKVQSYMACAKPVIAALDGEGARVINDARAGLVAPTEDPEALAQAVLTMYKMPDTERCAMGARGRQYFELNFERRTLLERLDGWVKELRPEE